jgi:hypothetical protein
MFNSGALKASMGGFMIFIDALSTIMKGPENRRKPLTSR